MPLPSDFAKLAPQDILDIAAFIEHEAQDHLTDEPTRAMLAELQLDELGHIAMLEEQRGRLAARP